MKVINQGSIGISGFISTVLYMSSVYKQLNGFKFQQAVIKSQVTSKVDCCIVVLRALFCLALLKVVGLWLLKLLLKGLIKCDC